jgi:arylsulfatase A-like enzyme
VDPRPEAVGARGRVVHDVTESVDILPTICEFIGIDVPLQADGRSLAAFLRGEPAPSHWRDTAHYEWSFADPVNRAAERMFDVPMSHCALAVSRGPRYKYVQFASADDIFPPLLFDLDKDPGQTENVLAGREPEAAEMAWRCAQELTRWHMRSAERTLSGSFLHPTRGLVEARDDWV